MLDTHRLAAMATRVVAGDLFGLDRLVPVGHAHPQPGRRRDYEGKTKCIAQIGEFAEVMGVRRKYREAIDQCMDEMLMNALYDAPVDEQGRPIFADIPVKTRIQLKVEQRAVVQVRVRRQCASRSRCATRSARSPRATVWQYLYKCLHAEQQIDRKAGGAGLGLYLMVNAASQIYFNVLPRVATEVVCVFDLETPKIQLEEIGFFTEKIDAAGRLAGPAQRIPTGFPVERRASDPAPARSLPRGVVPVLAVAILAVLALIGVAVSQRISVPPPERAAVSITTIPQGRDDRARWQARRRRDRRRVRRAGPRGRARVSDRRAARGLPAAASRRAAARRHEPDHAAARRDRGHRARDLEPRGPRTCISPMPISASRRSS